MFTTLTLTVVNHALRRNDWALQRLRAHAGKTARIACNPVTASVCVRESGELGPARGTDAPDVTISMTPGTLLRLLAHDERVWSEVAIEGDSDYATALHRVWQHLDWGIEEDLSRFVGDIAAHRIVGMGQEVRSAARHAADSAVRNAREYWTEERPVLALRRDIEAYNRSVDALRDDVARIEKRVAALQSAAAGRFGAEYGQNTTPPPVAEA